MTEAIEFEREAEFHMQLGGYSYKWAAQEFEKAGQQKKARLAWKKFLEHHKAVPSFSLKRGLEYEAVYFEMAKAYEKLGMPKKAREAWIKAAEEAIAEKKLEYAAEYLVKAGLEGKAGEVWTKLAEQEFARAKECIVYPQIYVFSAKAYEKAGLEEKAQEVWKMAAEQLMVREKYAQAAEAYAKLGQMQEAKQAMQLHEKLLSQKTCKE